MIFKRHFITLLNSISYTCIGITYKFMKNDCQISDGTVNTTSLMKRQFVVTDIICQTELTAWLDSWVTDTPSVKMLCP